MKITNNRFYRIASIVCGVLGILFGLAAWPFTFASESLAKAQWWFLLEE